MYMKHSIGSVPMLVCIIIDRTNRRKKRQNQINNTNPPIVSDITKEQSH